MSERNSVLTVEVMDSDGSTFTLHEVCERGECHAEFVIKLVSYGIIAPVEPSTEARQWLFDVAALARLHKARRLQRDLKMNLPGLAVSMDLLDEVQAMRKELERTRHQLQQLMEG